MAEQFEGQRGRQAGRGRGQCHRRDLRQVVRACAQYCSQGLTGLNDLFLCRSDLLVEREQLRARLGGLGNGHQPPLVTRGLGVQFERLHAAQLLQQVQVRVDDLDLVVKLRDAGRHLQLRLRRLGALRVLLAKRRTHEVALLAPHIDIVVGIDADQSGPVPGAVRADGGILRSIGAEETMTGHVLAIRLGNPGDLQIAPGANQLYLGVGLRYMLTGDRQRRRMTEAAFDQRFELRVVIVLPPARRGPAFACEMDIVGETDLVLWDERRRWAIVMNHRAGCQPRTDWQQHKPTLHEARQRMAGACATRSPYQRIVIVAHCAIPVRQRPATLKAVHR